MEELKNKMLEDKNWVVIGFTPNEDKYGYKIYKKLKENKYNVHPVNPKYEDYKEFKVYNSIKEVKEKIDSVSVVVPPKVSEKLLEELKNTDIKNIWFQPGTFDENIIEKAENLGFNIVFYDCVLVELGKKFD